jgi:predicted NBD/HSP70 family sugar kinase
VTLPLHVDSGGLLGNRNDRARRENLSTILTLLHHRGATTRAELTRTLGLNRSTIATLVAELAEHGLVSDSATDSTRGRGRPSHTVNASTQVAVVAVVPDSDSITVGIVGLGGVVHERVRIPVSDPPTADETVRTTRAVLDDLDERIARLRLVGAGVAVPGLVHATTGVVELAPHLGWADEAIADAMSAAVDLPVAVINDAHAGLIAETRFGAAQGAKNLVYLNGSYSGIGGGILIDGTPLLGSRGLAAELGHVAVASDRPCHCGRRGCLETEVRLEFLLTAARTMHGSGMDLEDIARDTTDTAVRREMARQLGILAGSLADLISVLNPSHFLLGGFLGTLFASDPDGFRAAVERLAFAPLASGVTVGRAALGSNLLIIGAAEAAIQPLLHDPTSHAPRRPPSRVPTASMQGE